MKQKVVIKLQMEDEKKRRKAMKLAVLQSGVSSAAIEADKNQIVVVGDGVDSVALMMALRKNLRFAELVSVAPVEEKKEDKKEEKKPETAVHPVLWFPPPPAYYCVPDGHYQESGCYIL